MSKIIYENCELFGPDGVFLGFIPSNRFNWYIKKDLAEIIGDKQIKLKFDPIIKNSTVVELVGKDKCKPKENKCVVCGNTDGINRYKIMPNEIKKLLPSEYKAHRANDVVVLCDEDIPDADYFLKQFKLEMFKKYDIDILKFKLDSKTNIAYVHAKKLLNKSSKISDYAIKQLHRFFGKEPTDEDLKKFIEDCNISMSYEDCKTPEELLVKKVVSKNETIDFLNLWKQNFVDTMEPQFLQWDFWLNLGTDDVK